MADLVSTVWVTGEDGQPVSFGPGDDVPSWAKEQMGDHCFVDTKTESDEPAKPSRRSSAK